jgi:hypothetical protein
MNKLLRYLLPSMGGLLFVLVLFGAVSKGPVMLNIDGDLGRHLTVGGLILDSRSIPLVDVFSHSMSGVELTPHEWLSQVLFALVYRWLGLDGVVLMVAVLVAAALYITYRQALRCSGSVLAALLLAVLAMAASSLHWLPRPHIFTLLLVVVWAAGLEALRRGQTKYWFGLPVLMLVWANLHGAFIAGFMVWGLYGVAYAWEQWIERGEMAEFNPGFWRIWALVGAVSGLASLVNPVGARLWVTSLSYLGNSYLVGHTAEYLSPDFHSPSFWPFLLLILLGLGLFGLGAKRRSMLDVILFTAWVGMSLISARNIPLFAVLAAPMLAGSLREVLDQLAARHTFFAKITGLDSRLTATETSLRGVLWPVAATGLLVLGMAGQVGQASQSANRFDPAVFPVEAVTWLGAHPQSGEMYNYFPWGGYILYRDWPSLRVFIDGQTDFYGESLTRKYEQALTMQDDWQDMLAQYKVGWVILPPNEALARALSQDPAWTVVYRDDTATIIVRK